MRVILQRVSSASVSVDGVVVASVRAGVLALVGLAAGDGAKEREWATRRLLNTRLWEDASGRAWARGAKQLGYEVLLVSQFTLHAVLKGNKPDFHKAMAPDAARAEWGLLVEAVGAAHPGGKVQSGVFGANMQVQLVNDGPVTIELDSDAGAAAAAVPGALATAAAPVATKLVAAVTAPPASGGAHCAIVDVQIHRTGGAQLVCLDICRLHTGCP